MKIRPVGADLFHADRRTDLAKLMVAFRNFCERALKERKYHHATWLQDTC